MTQILEEQKFDSKIIEREALQILEDFQAINIVKRDLPHSCSYADTIIIATGRSSRQMASIADAIKKELSKHLTYRIQIEGLEKAEWVLIDLGNIIIHLFKEEIRAFYQLEKLWDHD